MLFRSVFPCATGDEAYRGSAVETIEGVRLIKEALPGCTTILGISNVSFGLPCRQLINDVFLILAVEAGAGSALIDPTSSSLSEVFSIDRSASTFQLAEDVLLGRDEYCARFIRAYRKGELTA